MSTMFIGFLIILISGVGLLATLLIKSMVAPKKIESIQKLLKSGKYSAAVKQARLFTNKNPRDAEARYLLGKAYLAEGKSELALMEFKAVNATALFSKVIPETEFRNTIAQLYLKYNQPEEALKEYLLLIKLEPFNAEYYFKTGVLFEERNNTDQAIQYYKKAVETDPKHASAHASLGLLMYRMKQAQVAKDYLKTALRLDPHNNKALFVQGKILRENHDYANALATFEKVLRDPEYKQKAYIERGACYVEANSLEKSIIEFERAIASSKDDASMDTLYARYFLAESYEKTRNIDKAIAQWELIFSKRRNFKDVGEKLTQYQEIRTNDHMKEYLTSNKEAFFNLCKAITNQGLDLSVREITEERYGCSIIAVEQDTEKWRNVRKMPRLILFYRDPNAIEDSFLRFLQETMKKQSIIRGIVITSSSFTRTALEFADNRPIELIGKDKLEQLLASVSL